MNYTLSENEIKTALLGFAALIHTSRKYDFYIEEKFQDKIETFYKEIYSQNPNVISDMVYHHEVPSYLMESFKSMFKSKEDDILTLKKLKREVEEKYFNLLCTDIVGSEAFRVVGVAEDDYDFYYISKNIKGEKKYHSALMKMIPLTTLDDYDQMDDIFEMNGCTREESILVEID